MIAGFFWFDWTFVLCSHTPVCMLFQRDVIKHQPFSDIDNDCISVFATSFNIELSDMQVICHQIPVSLDFILIKYKALSATYSKAVLDLSQSFKSCQDEPCHKVYCSVNVQLSCLESQKSVQLLEPLTFNDLNITMHPELYEKNCQLQHLTAVTMQQWNLNCSTADSEESDGKNEDEILV